MATLHDRINSLASDFAHQLLAALRGASLDDIIAETAPGHARRGPGRPRAQVAAGGGGEVPAPVRAKRAKRRAGRLARRSASDLAEMVDKLVEIVRSAKNGINAEGIKAALKVDRSELPRPIAMALKSGRIRKKGQKRATTYFSGASTSTSSPKAKKTTGRAKRAKKHVAHGRAPTKKVSKKVAKVKSSTRANGAAQAVPTAAAAPAS